MFRSPSTVARYLFTVEIAAMGKLLSRAVLLWFHIDREGSAEMVFFPSPISIAAGHPANRSVGIGKSFRCNVVVWDFLFERVGRAAERGRWRWRRDGSFAFLLHIAPVLSFRRASSRNRRSLSKSLPNLNALMAPPAPPGLTRNDVRRSILGGPFAIPTASLFITRYIPTRRSYLPRKFSILSALRPSLFKRGFAAHCPFPDFDLWYTVGFLSPSCHFNSWWQKIVWQRFHD